MLSLLALAGSTCAIMDSWKLSWRI